MIYLIKGSRVREYHRQNVEILSAAEGAPFEVAYSRRWIQTDLRPAENNGAVIVFSDSPYEHFTPIRFAVIPQIDQRSTNDGQLAAMMNDRVDTGSSSRTTTSGCSRLVRRPRQTTPGVMPSMRSLRIRSSTRPRWCASPALSWTAVCLNLGLRSRSVTVPMWVSSFGRHTKSTAN